MNISYSKREFQSRKTEFFYSKLIFFVAKENNNLGTLKDRGSNSCLLFLNKCIHETMQYKIRYNIIG